MLLSSDKAHMSRRPLVLCVNQKLLVFVRDRKGREERELNVAATLHATHRVSFFDTSDSVQKPILIFFVIFQKPLS